MAMDRVQECFDLSYRRLMGQLYAVCGDLTEAEEVVSEAFVRAAAQPARFAKVDNPEAWLRIVAVNMARSRHRRRKFGERLGFAQPAAPTHPELSIQRMALVQALGQLPDGQREALALHYLADLPVQQVAETLGVPVGTVKARLSRRPEGDDPQEIDPVGFEEAIDMRGTLSTSAGPLMVADTARRDRVLVSTDGEVWKSVRTR